VLGTLDTTPAADRPDLLAPSVAAAVAAWHGDEIFVPALADTAEFCARYAVSLAESANCVIVAGRRGDATRLAACVVLATTRADVNGLVRRRLDARKASFAPVDLAVVETGMEYGGITPVGLPPHVPVLVDAAVAASARVVVGSGVRRSKLVVTGTTLASWPGAEVLEGLGLPASAS
jgi:prolyl-tRNA editing enzyme YbaK/EbsC (Cys-tRNA(Pro) deacylase)